MAAAFLVWVGLCLGVCTGQVQKLKDHRFARLVTYNPCSLRAPFRTDDISYELSKRQIVVLVGTKNRHRNATAEV